MGTALKSAGKSISAEIRKFKAGESEAAGMLSFYAILSLLPDDVCLIAASAPKA